jgi:hypothetical protein
MNRNVGGKLKKEKRKMFLAKVAKGIKKDRRRNPGIMNRNR